jgi:coenzyme F420-reducing hydrogenase gamma subunit
VQQRDAFEGSLRARGEALASLRAAAKERDGTFRISNPEVRPGFERVYQRGLMRHSLSCFLCGACAAKCPDPGLSTR